MTTDQQLPLVIITPTYNRADFFPETIDSILGQDYPRIEYIEIDDGLRDNTRQGMASCNVRLRYIFHDSTGEAKTVNKGLKLTTGDIFCLVNSDAPLFRKDAVSIAVGTLQMQPDSLMDYSEWVSIDRRGNLLHEMRLTESTFEKMITRLNESLEPGFFYVS